MQSAVEYEIEVCKICMACFVLGKNIRSTDLTVVKALSLPVEPWHHFSPQHPLVNF